MSAEKNEYIIIEYIEELRKNAEDLISIRTGSYGEKWEEELTNVQKALDYPTLLLFLGEFSSGKSSFINVLLGDHILPTSKSPCTSLITEIKFASDDGGNKGEIFYSDKSKSPENDFGKLIELIEGNHKKTFGSFTEIDHITLIYNIPKECKEGPRGVIDILAKNEIMLVDFPGFNSPYGIDNVEIINRYISLATNVFWFFSADKIGGSIIIDTGLRNLNNTRKIIPVIAKSDLIKSENLKEDIREKFKGQYSDVFQGREPIFISSKKIQEYMKKTSSITEENEDAVKLREESGIERLAREMMVKKEGNSDVKNQEITKTLIKIAESIIEKAGREKKDFDNKLTNVGYVPGEEDKKIRDIKDKLEDYCRKESKIISQNFAEQLSAEVVNALKNKKNVEQIKAIFGKIKEEHIEPELAKIVDKIIKDFQVGFQEFNLSIPIKEPDLEPFKNKLFRNVLSVFDSIQKTGPQAVLTGGVGAFLLASLPAIKGVSLVGGTLAAITGPVGLIMLVFGLIPFVPNLLSAHSERKEEAEKKVRNEIRNLTENLQVEREIRKKLFEIIDEIYGKASNRFEESIRDLIKNREKISNIKNNLEELLSKMT